MRQNTRSYQQPQLFWPKVVVRKWLNISAKEYDYSADTDSDGSTPIPIAKATQKIYPYSSRKNLQFTFCA